MKMIKRIKLSITILFAIMWLLISIKLSLYWIKELNNVFHIVIVIIIITGIAYLPGFIGINLIASLILLKLKPNIQVNPCQVTILIPIHNEEKNIYDTLFSIARQDYEGMIKIIVIDNDSRDQTLLKVKQAIEDFNLDIDILSELQLGKDKALNKGLAYVNTPYFITLDGDTVLHFQAIRTIFSTIINGGEEVGAVAGGILVKNDDENLLTKMQVYDYLLSISSIKNMQSMYSSTLVAQGAFSIYQTAIIKALGGWDDVLGEDIILTWKLLKIKKQVLFEPRALCFTVVPNNIKSFLKQRSRWARGMIEGLRLIKPWEQGTIYAKYLTLIDFIIPFIDLSYVLFFIPGVILGLANKFYLFGPFSLSVIPLVVFCFYLMYETQKRNVLKPLKVKLKLNLIAFLLFIIIFQALIAYASLIGYFQEWFKIKRKW